MAKEKSTDDKADKPARPPKGEKPEKPAKASKGDSAPKAGKPPKGEKPAKGDKGESAGKSKKAAAESAEPQGPPPPPRLRDRYRQEVLPSLSEKFGRANRMALPRMEKIVVNMGVGSATQEKKHLETAAEAMGLITGQKPIITKSRKAISAFRLREDMPIGCKVTLRGRKMYEFLDRLVSIVLPRVRDFRGINRKAFDGQGSYSLGLSEQLVFPELNPDKFTRVQGMNITIVVRNASDDESRELLTQLGLPFQAEEPAADAKKK
jgi:large subunit ribosomal protein L5